MTTNREWLDGLAASDPHALAEWFDSEHVPEPKQVRCHECAEARELPGIGLACALRPSTWYMTEKLGYCHHATRRYGKR